MNGFKLPFNIIHPNFNEFIIAKCYETKQECYKLTIPEASQLETPIRILFCPEKNAHHLSLGIEVKRKSRVTIIEEWSTDISTPNIDFINHITCQAGATLDYLVLNKCTENISFKEERRTSIAEKARCHFFACHFGTKELRSKLIQKTSGQRAHMDTSIIAKSSGRRTLNLSCTHHITEKEGTGEIIMKGIAQDQASLSFDGMINIEQNGGASNNYLKQEVLNLSSSGRVKTIPNLKIDTNDVKIGHRASIQNLSEEDLYYTAARGIERNTARKLLITGFLKEELKTIKDHKAAYEMIRELL